MISEFGKKLKKERTAKKYSLDDFSRITKIPQKHLQALETGALEESLAPVYVLGIIRAYGDALGLDTDALFDEYLTETKKAAMITRAESQKEFTSAVPLKEKIFSRKTQMITPKTLSYLFTALFALFVLGFLFYQFTYLTGGPHLVLLEPTADLITSKQALTFQGRVTPTDSTVTVNNEVLYTNERGEFGEVISLASGSNIFEVKATNKYGKTATIVRKVLKE